MRAYLLAGTIVLWSVSLATPMLRSPGAAKFAKCSALFLKCQLGTNKAQRISLLCASFINRWRSRAHGSRVQVALAVSAFVSVLLGCATKRRYGFKVFQPPGNFSLAASSESDGTMITSSPSFQLTGVATLYLAVSCSESITRRISSKLRPVLAG